jgi:hypothetical protein
MKNISLHPFSMFAGAALAGVGFLLLGAQTVSGATRLLLQGPLLVVTPPTPRQMVHIDLSALAYIVPAGKIFVATGATPISSSPLITVLFGNRRVLELQPTGVPIVIPPGLSAPAGTSISGNNGTLLGYLAED